MMLEEEILMKEAIMKEGLVADGDGEENMMTMFDRFYFRPHGQGGSFYVHE